MKHLLISLSVTRRALFASLCLLRCVSGAEPKPDVLVILTDQWSPRYLSWENPEVRTPNLDRIARDGLIFDACYTTSPVCMPARISLVTGLYPHNHGHAVWGNVMHYYVPAEAATMFGDIQRAGYTTAQIGKLHWFSGANWKRDFQTVDEYHRALGLNVVVNGSGPPDSPNEKSPYCQHLRELGVLDAVATDMHDRYVKGEYLPRPSVVKPDDYHDSFTTGAAVDYIRSQPADKPMCLVVSLHSPHPPLDAPGEFATMYAPESLTLPPNVPESFARDKQSVDRTELRKWLANYLGKISLADHNVGRLVAAMQQRGTWDNALVIFTSDHGEMMGSHGAMTKGRFYEESARVPLVIRWPQHVRPGRTKALAQMFDVYPTIVEAIGGQLTIARMARSLLPVATGKAAAVRSLAISEIGNLPPLRIMARDLRYKWWAEDDREFLFDMDNDPFELHNLAGEPEHRDTLNRMHQQMLLCLRSTQVNLAEGYKSKVQRLREAEAEKSGTAGKKKTREKGNP